MCLIPYGRENVISAFLTVHFRMLLVIFDLLISSKICIVLLCNKRKPQMDTEIKIRVASKLVIFVTLSRVEEVWLQVGCN